MLRHRSERTPHRIDTTRRVLAVAVSLLLGTAAGVAWAEDWPEWRGAGRRGVWTEDGIVEELPAQGLTYTWRTPVHGGYAGPAVAGGRVFVTDFRRVQGNDGVERALSLDEATGEVLWSKEWTTSYAGIMPRYAIGPRATPTVDANRVFVLGAMGALLALDVKTGEVLWQKDFVKEYGTEVPVWGMAGAPLVNGDLLIALVGGEAGAKVVAFEKTTGREVWRALSSDWEPGYNAPVLMTSGGRSQVIVWQPRAISSLDPATGEVLWEEPFDVRMGLTVASPVYDEGRLLVSAFYNGSMMLELDPDEPRVRRVWRGKSDSEVKTDGLHALISTPVLQGEHVYGICSYGQLRCLDAKTGERVWESMDLTRERARWASAFFVRHGDRYFINNDRGELIIARLSPQGYDELSRTRLIEPTSPAGPRRELKAVHWSHPAYANRHIVVRNDREILRASLARE